MPLLTTEQRIERVRRRVEELSLWVDRTVVELDRWSAGGARLRPGDRWPRRDGVVSFSHPEVEVPAEWPLEETRLELEIGGEGLVRIRHPDGAEASWGVDPEHRAWPLERRALALEVQAVARRPFGTPNPDPRLACSRLVHVDAAVERLARRLTLVAEAAEALGPSEVVDPLLECAERALARLDWPSATEPYLARQRTNPWMRTLWDPLHAEGPAPALTEEQRAAVEDALERMTRELAELRARYPQRGALALSGHAHLDVAWLWPLEETRRKALRTFSTAAGLLERYPELTFNQSSAQIYRFVEEADPALFETVRKRVAEGRWEPIGGMWVEPDMNMPSGESIVRQLLYGQRYFERTFGALHEVCWLPDCFGFTPALPQLLLGAGIESFLTIKVNWSEMNRFPYDLFWWEGLDGSRVLAHTFDNPDRGYNGRATPATILSTWANYRGKHRHPESLLTIGYGDGGGGVNGDMLERVRELASFPSVPSLHFELVRDFFSEARRAIEGSDVPVWVGELYLEYHRGTLTTQARTKSLHRRAERELVAAEVVAGMAALAGAAEVPAPEDLWQVLLRNQFHDILPGSGVREIYEDAERELTEVVRAAGDRMTRALDELARRVAPEGSGDGVLLVNPDLSARPARLHVNDEVPGAQRVRDGYVLTTPDEVPGIGALVVTEARGAPGDLRASDLGLENPFLRVRLAPDGALESVFDKRAQREVLAGRANQLWAYVDKPRAWDAWDVDVSYTDAASEIVATRPPVVVEEGPHRAALRVERSFRDSRIVQEVRLWANSARLDFATELEWHDRRFMLKARFPLAVRATHALFETAFGVVQRPTYRNTTWDTAQFEVPGHRFADLSEPGYGAALLNTGKYGHHALRNELGLTLLRSPFYPDPRADEGRHAFTYALLPHPGTWVEGGVLAEAEDLNRPLLTTAVTGASPGSWAALRLEGLVLGLGALKAREDGDGLVLRVYEPQGARGRAAVELPDPWRLGSELDLLERPLGAPDLSFTPFRVRSWLLREGRGKT